MLDLFDNNAEQYDNLKESLEDINDHFILDEYLAFLRTNELVVEIDADEIVLFPEISIQWDYPAHIVSAIIEICSSNLFYLKEMISQLEDLLCHSLMLNVFVDSDGFDYELLKNLLKDSSFESICIDVTYADDKQTERINSWRCLQNNCPQITHLNVSDHNIHQNKSKKPMNITCSNRDFHCDTSFTINLPFFTESQCHNTCLNRKICIDAEGNIKNCPAMAKNYGNIKDTPLEEAINKPGFKDLWYICKDQIDVCKDCEFRHLCTDCRAFIKDPENIYSQPAKCTYNPYICLWEGQDGYVPVEECGTYSRKTGFVPDSQKIERLKRVIWNEV